MKDTSDRIVRKKEYERNINELKDELEKMWKVKVNVIPVKAGATPKLEKWLKQIPGTTPEIFFQKSALLGIVNCAESSIFWASGDLLTRRLQAEDDQNHPQG